MDKYLKSKIKLRILKLLNWIPDKEMIKLQYWIKTGRKVDLDNPIRYTEKLQWYKLYYRMPIMAICADKYKVRKFVERRGLGYILNECYGVYDRAEEIPWNALPDKFVIKATNGASGIGIKIVEDKESVLQYGISLLVKELNAWLQPQKNGGGREWVYYKYRPRLVIEKYLDQGNGQSLIDYKFFCFDGEPFCLYVMNERFSKLGVRQSIMDLNYDVMPYMRKKIEPIRTKKALVKPANFDELKIIAKKLSKGFPYVRVDLYDIDRTIYFGEMTFFPESGYYDFIPDEFDYILGEKFKLPMQIKPYCAKT